MLNWIARMKKRKIVLLMLLGLLAIACITPFSILVGIPFVQEWRTKQGLEIIEDAEHLFEDLSIYGGSTAQRSIYYWIDDPIDEVRNYYEGFTTDLARSEDEFGMWYIGLLESQNTELEQIESTYRVHGNLCDYQNRYDCVSVALVDVSQSEFYRLPVSSPSQFRRSELPSAFATLPDYGTLIIFSYYVSDF